jgi:hypothetical protein
MEGAYNTHETKEFMKVLISKRKWKRPLGRLGTRWEASLGICLKK